MGMKIKVILMSRILMKWKLFKKSKCYGVLYIAPPGDFHPSIRPFLAYFLLRRVNLTYCKAFEEVLELRNRSLLFDSSRQSCCTIVQLEKSISSKIKSWLPPANQPGGKEGRREDRIGRDWLVHFLPTISKHFSSASLQIIRIRLSRQIILI